MSMTIDTTKPSRYLISSSLFNQMISNQLPNNVDIINFVPKVGAASFNESMGEGIGFGLGVSVVIDESKVKGGQFSCKGEYGW